MSPSRRSGKKGKSGAKNKENDKAEEPVVAATDVSVEAVEAAECTPQKNAKDSLAADVGSPGTNLKRFLPPQNQQSPCKKSHVELALIESQSGLDAEFGFKRTVDISVASVPRVDSKYSDNFHVAFQPVGAATALEGSQGQGVTVGSPSANSNAASGLFAGTESVLPVKINFALGGESSTEEDASSSATLPGQTTADPTDADSSVHQESDGLESDTLNLDSESDEKKRLLPMFMSTAIQSRVKPIVLHLRSKEHALKELNPSLHKLAKYLVIVWTFPIAISMAFMSIPLLIPLVLLAMFLGVGRTRKSLVGAYIELKELLE
ncbi:hypothetical protein HDU81_010397 [Chytriomyces hyalinus]|nr:hypothetical protein HDU81_010397 [Chytriomyces hyalinus]